PPPSSWSIATKRCSVSMCCCSRRRASLCAAATTSCAGTVNLSTFIPGSSGRPNLPAVLDPGGDAALQVEHLSAAAVAQVDGGVAAAGPHRAVEDDGLLLIADLADALEHVGERDEARAGDDAVRGLLRLAHVDEQE